MCSYCEETEKTFSLDEIADRLETAFEEHYRLTASEPSAFEYHLVKEGDRDWNREGSRVAEVISCAAEIDSEPAEDLRQILADRHFDSERAKMGEEGPFDKGTHYTEKGVDDLELHIGWSEFETHLKTEARFLSRSAQKTLDEVFGGLLQHQTRSGTPVIIGAGPGTEFVTLCRARVFRSDDDLKKALLRPDLGIGPPQSLAASAGRMNARGISVFYGATDCETALAEVRPPVGSRVVVARFEIIRTIRLLHLEALRSVFVEGSIFDPSYIGKLQRAKFLGALKVALQDMAGESRSCMFCDHNEPTDVEHFKPKTEFPRETFLWSNMLWICTTCNRLKGSSFPPHNCTGAPILDPSTDQVWDFFFLDEFGTLIKRWDVSANGYNARAQSTCDYAHVDREEVQTRRQKRMKGLRALVQQLVKDFKAGNVTLQELNSRVRDILAEPFQADVADFYFRGPGMQEEPFAEFLSFGISIPLP